MTTSVLDQKEQGDEAMMGRENLENEPVYFISVVSRMVGVHAQTLRYYERVGLISPSRSGGRQRLYSLREVQKLQRIKTLTEDMGVNLAGVEVILKLLDQVAKLEGDVVQLQEEVARLSRTSARRSR